MLARFPNAIANAASAGFTQGTYSTNDFAEYSGGLSAQTYQGKLPVSPGTTDPIIWTRGSLYNLGYTSALGDRGASNQPLGFASYWDAPRAWGNPATLVRLPNTLLLYNNFDVADFGPRVDAAFASYFGGKNVSVCLFPSGNFGFLGLSAAITRGIPFQSVTWTDYDTLLTPENAQGYLRISAGAPVIDKTLFRAGKVMVATLGNNGIMQGYGVSLDWQDAAHPTQLPVNFGGMTRFLNHHSAPGPHADDVNYVGYVFDAKIAADLAVQADAVTKFTDLLNVYYTPTFDTYDNAAALLIPDSAFAAATGPNFRVTNYTQDDADDLWTKVMTDATAFFGA